MKKIVLMIALVCCCGMNAQEYTLEQLQEMAVQNNRTLKNARLDVDAAKEDKTKARTNFLPHVSAAAVGFHGFDDLMQTSMPAGEQTMPISMVKKGFVGSVMAVQPLFQGGQIVNGNRLASLGEQVGELRLEVRENQVILTTEQYYWQLQAMQEKLRTLAAVETLLERLNSDATAAVSAGVALRNDLLQVQLRQNEVLSNKLQLCNGIALLKMVLAQYCGLSDTAFVCATALPDVIDLPAKWNHSAALANTPEYRLLEKNVQASELQRRLEVGKHLPTVAVGAGFFYHNLLDNDKPYAMLMASVSIPISDWWGGSHAIKRKKIELQKANEQLIDNSQLLEIRMQQTWDELYVAYQQVDIARQSIAQADENLRISRDCYRAGTVTMSDLLQAQLLQQQAHDRLADAKADYRLKLIAYNQATGHRR